eukprot:495637-Alexandrium_andersonii.AAC.1
MFPGSDGREPDLLPEHMSPFLRSVSLPPPSPPPSWVRGSRGGGVPTLPPDELMNWNDKNLCQSTPSRHFTHVHSTLLS